MDERTNGVCNTDGMILKWENQTQVPGENMSHCHFIHHKPHVNSPGTEHELLWWEANDHPPEPWYNPSHLLWSTLWSSALWTAQSVSGKDRVGRTQTYMEKVWSSEVLVTTCLHGVITQRIKHDAAGDSQWISPVPTVTDFKVGNDCPLISLNSPVTVTYFVWLSVFAAGRIARSLKNEWRIGKELEGSGRGLTEVTSGHLSGRFE
jgi:hypothetical protein